jgi:hypothetical protein
MWFFLSFPRRVDSAMAGLEEAEEPSGGQSSRLSQIFLTPLSLQKISPVCQDDSPQAMSLDSRPLHSRRERFPRLVRSQLVRIRTRLEQPPMALSSSQRVVLMKEIAVLLAAEAWFFIVALR